MSFQGNAAGSPLVVIIAQSFEEADLAFEAMIKEREPDGVFKIDPGIYSGNTTGNIYTLTVIPRSELLLE